MVTLDEIDYPRLRALPVAYDEVDTRAGLVAPEFEVQGLLTAAEVAEVTLLFEAWQALKQVEPPAVISGVVGSTVAFSATTGGRTWTELPCWFTAAPATTPIGARFRVVFRLVDAAKSLAVELLQQQQDDASELTFGTLTIGTATLTLLEPLLAYGDGPTVSTAMTGATVIEGPLVASRLQRIRGFSTNSGTFAAIGAWFEAEAASLPESGDWYPISAPEFEAEERVIAGVKTIRYLVTMTRRLIP